MANIKVNTVEDGIINIPVTAGSEFVIGVFTIDGNDPDSSNKSRTCIKVTDIDGNKEVYTIDRLEYNDSDTYSRGIQNAWSNGGFKQPGNYISEADKNLSIESKLQDNLDNLVNSILLDGESRFYAEAMPWISSVETVKLKEAVTQFRQAKSDWQAENVERKDAALSRGDSEFRLSTGGILSVDTNVSEIAAFSCGDFKIGDPLQGPFKYMDIFQSASN